MKIAIRNMQNVNAALLKGGAYCLLLWWRGKTAVSGDCDGLGILPRDIIMYTVRFPFGTCTEGERVFGPFPMR